MLIMYLIGFPDSVAYGTWQTYQGNAQHTGVQTMRGNFYCGSATTVWTYTTGNWIISQATVADIDGDGNPEVVVGSYDHIIYAFDGRTGALEWTRNLGSVAGEYTPNIADMDNDSALEVVISTWSGDVFVLDGATGTVEVSRNIGGTDASTSVGDVNADGLLDIIVQSGNGTIYAYTPSTNTILWSRSISASDGSFPAIAQLDGDPCKEVIAGGSGTRVYALDGCTGSVEWSLDVGCSTYSNPPAVGDIDEDGDMDVVIGSNCSKFHFIDGPSGTELSGSPFTSSATYTFPTAGIYDVDGDGHVEVFKGNRFGHLYRFRGSDRGVVWSRSLSQQYPVGEILADMDISTPGFEVVTASYHGYVYILNSSDGSTIWYGNAVGNLRNVSVADADGDGFVELILTGESPPQIAVIDDNCPYGRGDDLAVNEGNGEGKPFLVGPGRITFTKATDYAVFRADGSLLRKGRAERGTTLKLGRGVFFVRTGKEVHRVVM